ncbi:hypothetical protein AAFF_G00401480 [Aldrovandia affinis]|uniref:Alpha-2B adrenergic receptor n=1 Tax=Aldrovandia affinis TaxID=143900 RepID=A0AAD7WL62_9TELE|nr:hypothetical protein AAFF_G00401480 [Aldrovandia affinis]
MATVVDGACLTGAALGSRNASAPPTCNQSAVKLPPYSPEATAAFATVITIMMLFTIFGNILVIIAVLTSRLLRGPQNLFLVSLAAADILVATLIIPFSLANELLGYWYFRSAWCQIYLALDVLFCTSSIVHLCAISLDRYLSVSRAVRYSAQRTPRRIKAAILVVWLISAVISFPPLLSVNKARGRAQCQLNSERWYILYSSIGSFFAPCVIMILVYVRIYQIAKRHTRCPPGRAAIPPPASPVPQAQQNGGGASAVPRKRAALRPPVLPLPPSSSSPAPAPPPFPITTAGPPPSPITTAGPPPSPITTAGPPPSPLPPLPRGGRGAKSMADNNNDDSSNSESDGEAANETSGAPLPGRSYRDTVVTATGTALQEQRATPSTARRKAMLNREKRFTFVLAVVIGVFVLCWFPFFFSYSLKAVCPEACALPEPLFKFFFWIGYCNSSLNPLIYTIFNKDFRKAFNKILCKSTKDTAVF